MVRVEIPVYSMSDTAIILRVRLGALRAWYPFLCDNIRGKQDIFGRRLLPCAQQRGSGKSKNYQPVYAESDIFKFVDWVKAMVPSAGKAYIKPKMLIVDKERFWKFNKFDADGLPVARLVA